jgi:hypothetical protein
MSASRPTDIFNWPVCAEPRTVSLSTHLEPITDVALAAGFEHSESFARAFKSAFGQSPLAFRKAPDWAAWSKQFQFLSPREIAVMQVRIVDVESVTVAVLEHRGDPGTGE